MSTQHNYFSGSNAQASGSNFNSKRKRTSWCVEDFAFEQNKQMRVRSPGFERRHTYPAPPPPELIADSSANTSDEDQGMMDHDMDMDHSSEVDQEMDAGGGGFEYENGAVQHGTESMDRSENYAFGVGGSGGFGFGPGAMEDDEDEESAGKATYPYQLYPSLTPHPNPHHFSNLSNPSTVRAKSPLSAQPFSTSLRAPLGRTPGLLQPASAQPLSHNATDVERARNQHGPQCRSIPKLVMSQYPDPSTGERSLWSHCGDCGAVERKM